MTVEDPLAAHLISQIEQNVQLLASQNYLSQADAIDILARLPQGGPSSSSTRATGGGAMSQFTNKFSKLVSPNGGGRAVPPPPPAAPIHAPNVVHAKALWGYNENGEDPKDLTFSAGDIIEIVEETNQDWWKGRYNGREGLVPANYVQKVAPPASAPMSMPTPGPRPYKPFGAAYHGVNNNNNNNNVAAPPVAGPAGLQEAPDTQEKKDKYGGLKNTLAHSAAGGVGFGAGAAIGGGLVRAIF